MLKPILGAFLLIIALRTTGLLGTVADLTRSAAIETGAFDANPKETALKKAEDFDYNFSIKDLKGNALAFGQFKGKLVFLNLWATWCGPCRAEMPTIQKLYDGIAKDSVAFVMLSLDRDMDKDKIIRYIQSKSYSFPVYQPSGYLTEQLNIPTIPTTFVISKEGKIIAKEVGTTNFNTVKFRKFLEANW